MERKIFGFKIPEINIFRRKKPTEESGYYWRFSPSPFNPGYVFASVMEEVGFPVEMREDSKDPDTGEPLIVAVWVKQNQLARYSEVAKLFGQTPEDTLLYEVWRSAPSLILDFMRGTHFAKQGTNQWAENNQLLVQKALKAAIIRDIEYQEDIQARGVRPVSQKYLEFAYALAARIEEPELNEETFRLIIRQKVDAILEENPGLRPEVGYTQVRVTGENR